jgi:exoribonuclease R
MLPNIYSDDLISLLENKKRYSLSLIIVFNKKFNIISENIKETIVKNIKNFNYDEFDKSFKNDNNLKEFVLFSNKFFKESENNSHKLVENWMIYTNKYVANYLIKKDLSNLILRKHECSYFNLDNKNLDNDLIKNLDNDLIKNLDNDLIKYLKNNNQNSAYYEIYNKELNQKHHQIGDTYYTHMTSPIRRAVDFFIHLLIIKNKNIIENEELNKYIEKINIFTKNSRKFERNVKRLEFLYNVKKLDENIETYCYIISIGINKITVFIPEYNLEEKIIIIHYKFIDIASIKLNRNENNIIDKIDYNIDNIYKSYNLYQKINIKLWIFTSFENIFDKLKILL